MIRFGKLLEASSSILLGDGATASFWHDGRLFGKSLRISFPDLSAVCTKRYLSVREALADLRWCSATSPQWQIVQFSDLWEAAQNVQLADVRYSLTWKWTNNGVFTIQSAYNIQFESRIATDFHHTGTPMLCANVNFLLALPLRTCLSISCLTTQSAPCALFILNLRCISSWPALFRNRFGTLSSIVVRSSLDLI
jgi:hypothetical protein